MVGVRADVAQYQGLPASVGIEAPVGRAFALHQGGVVTLHVGELDLAHRPDDAGADHVARLPDHGVGGIVVRQAEHPPARAHPMHEVDRIDERGRQGLVADHVEALLQGCGADRMVAVVGGHHRDRVGAIAARLLAR